MLVMVRRSTSWTRQRSAVRITISKSPSARLIALASLSLTAFAITSAAAFAMRGTTSRPAQSTGSQAPSVRKYADSNARSCTSNWSCSSMKSMVTTIVSRQTKGCRSSLGARAIPCSTSTIATLDDAAVSSEARRPTKTSIDLSGLTSSGFMLV